MSWNGRFRMVRTPAVGAAIVVGAVGAALLAGPLTGAQAAPYLESYYNGGFCYQSADGQENTSRLQFTEVNYDPNKFGAEFSWQLQKWDAESSQYYNDGAAFDQGGVAKYYLTTNGQYSDPNLFCKSLTSNPPLKGSYPRGEWTSRRRPAHSPASSPELSQP